MIFSKISSHIFLKIRYLIYDIFHGKPTCFIEVYELPAEVLRIVKMPRTRLSKK